MSGQQTPRNKRKGSPLESQHSRYLSNEGSSASSSSDQPQIIVENQTARGSSSYFDQQLNQTPGGMIYPHSTSASVSLGLDQVQDGNLDRLFTYPYEYNTNAYGFPLSYNNRRSLSCSPDHSFSPDLHSSVPQTLRGGIVSNNPITPYSQQLHGSRTVTPAHRQQDKSSSYGQDQTAQYLPPNTIPQDVNYTYPDPPAITSVRPKIERLFCQDDTCNFLTGTEASLERHILNEHPGQDPEDWIQQALAIHVVSDAAGVEIFHCFHYLCDMEFQTEYARNLHHKSAHKGSKSKQEAWQ